MSKRASKQEKSFARELEMYSYVVNYKMSHDGNSPSIREIMEATEYASTAAVLFRLDSLSKLGLVRVLDNRSRSIEIVGGYADAYEKTTRLYLFASLDDFSCKDAIEKLVEWINEEK